MSSTDFRQLHTALLDLIGFLNGVRPDTILLETAGITLDRALFPLLVCIEYRGPLAIGELADLVGRDYTTISRQITKLEQEGLVQRRVSSIDSRIREIVITEQGHLIIASLNTAREKLMASVLAHWDSQEIREVARLTRKLADDAMKWAQNAPSKTS